MLTCDYHCKSIPFAKGAITYEVDYDPFVRLVFTLPVENHRTIYVFEVKLVKSVSTNTVKITDYQLHWDSKEHVGEVFIYSTEPKSGIFIANWHIDDPKEFAAVVDMLRKERPLWFHPETQTLYAGYETGDAGPLSDKETLSESRFESTSTSSAGV